ncbi:hypothetical protein EDD18DRAFT_80867 [Armillaria luteobubalina]|uniref:C2H2-type domain-containing protein n=1 Tax=Armillaria luteobubalina TaxID=153913 RepID=A0AA39Q944_9AGAR|nr:hypothetical protein EDD18DRAFT_80867 [Armillaria luteobubalina]
MSLPASPTFTAPSPYSSSSSVDTPLDIVSNDEHQHTAVVASTMAAYSPYTGTTQQLYAGQNDLVYPDHDYYHSMMAWTSPVVKKQQVPQGPYHSQQQQQMPNHPLSLFIPNGHHHHNQQQQQPSPVDEWQSHQQFSQAQSHALGMAHVSHYPRVKQEDLSSYQTHQNSHGHLYGLPTQQQQQQQLPSHSTSYTLMSSYYGIHEGYVHPSELSPAESPVSPLQMEYSHSHDSGSDSHGQQQQVNVACDPRFVSGEPLQGEERSQTDGDDADAEGDDDIDVEADNDVPDNDDDTYEEEFDDADYDDDRDGEYILRRARRPSASPAKRNLRTRTVSERYSPYAYPSPTYSNPLGIGTRPRRTISNATDSSVASSESSSSAYPPLPFQAPRRRSRSTTSLPVPVPVPNLTKKSRGRRVPTISSLDYSRRGDAVEGVKGARVHTCKVAGCGKCFARGEHLKRHVRSIHTYEKPHKCPYPGCGKDFSRHDNLGQHMRVHKDYRG